MVFVTHQSVDGTKSNIIGMFETIGEAEHFLAHDPAIDQTDLVEGRYSIEPPEEMC